jgi:hypothetical protein
VFLDFIHRLVSQEQTKLRENKNYGQKNTIHTSTNKSHKDQLLRVCVCLGLYAILVFPRFLCAVKCAVAVSLIATCV